MTSEQIKEIMSKVETQGMDSDAMLESITGEYIKPLNEVLKKIQEETLRFNGDIPLNALSNFIMELQPIIYFSLAGLEKIGARADIAEQMRISKLNTAYQGTTGSVGDKKAFSEEQSQDELFVSNIYARAYKLLKSRCEIGQNQIDSLKKIMSAKMSEISLTRSENYLRKINE